jgi:predicted phage terminase large subunit-like protein
VAAVTTQGLSVHELIALAAVRVKHRQQREEAPLPTLEEYIRASWHVLEPATEFLSNWHIGALAEYLQAVTDGEITRLLVNMPPRTMKSTCVTVDWPTWEWLYKPESRWGFFSYDQGLAIKHSVDRRRLIESPWYQEQWGHIFSMSPDQNQKSEYENSHRGLMWSTSLMASGTGKGGDRLVFDDPHNPTQVMSDAQRTADLRNFAQASGTRLNNKRTGAIVVVMQRLHEEDISARCIEEGYTHLCLPAVAEEPTFFLLPSGRAIEREAGSVLWPERDGPDELAASKRALGSYAYAGQYQQRPSPQEGGLLKRHWWRFWYPSTMQENPPPLVQVRLADGAMHSCVQEPLPDSFDTQLQSWDTTFKDTDASDYVAGGVWANKGSDSYLLDQVHDRMDVVAAMQALVALSEKWPNAVTKLIEDKANGSAIIRMVKGKVPGVIAVNPQGGKVARANSVAPRIEAGNVYLPHPLVDYRTQDFIEECANFPNGRHDDRVDQMTQALTRLALGRGRAA